MADYEKKVYSEFQAAGSARNSSVRMPLQLSFTLAQLSRRYDISSGLIRHWTKRYEQGGLVEGPSLPEKELRARNAELERMVGRLTMENDLLKKAVEYTLRRRKENSSPITAKSLAASKGGVK